MKRPATQCPPRPFAYTRRIPRTRSEAAASMVRLEYERERLTRDLEGLEARRGQITEQLQRIDARLETIQGVLADPSRRGRGA